MVSTPWAIAWPLWRRHRAGLLAVLAFHLCTVVVAYAVTSARLEPSTVIIFLLPVTCAPCCSAVYLMSVFSFAFDEDVSTSESWFPAYLFRLPVPTGALVGWPMAYGAAAMLLLWLLTGAFILRPWLALWNEELPLWWPAALAVATEAWFQTVLWVPLGLYLLRVVLAAALIPGMVAAAEFSVAMGLSEGFLVCLFGSAAGLAWVTGYVGVKHARRGDVPDWGLFFRPFGRLGRRLPRRRSPFASAGSAQTWFEWRRIGLSLPLMTLVMLPFVLLPLIFGKNDAIPAPRTLLGALAVPLLLAGVAGTTVSGNHPWVKDYYGVAPFTATLPMSTARLVGAKLKAAALSTLITWILTAAALVVSVTLTGNLDEVTALWRQWLGGEHPLKVAAAIVAAASCLILWTWKRLVDSVLLGLTGRKWIIQGAVFANLAVLVILGAIVGWVYKDPEYRAAFFDALPWFLGAFVFCRLLAAGWALRLTLRRGLLRVRTLLYWLMAWLTALVALFGAFLSIVPAEMAPPYYVALAVLLIMPMAHLAATPLALDWNRHR